ncbi:MAG: YibE/F family protein [Tissierellia bacterium]|nr:YibE/F family protein [Tissierellia bacterium]
MKKIIAIVLVVILIGIFVYWNNAEFGNSRWKQDTITYEKAKVIEVISEELNNDVPGITLGIQRIKVELLKSRDILTLDNRLTQTHNVFVGEGSKIIMVADKPEGVEPYYSVYNYDRIGGITFYIIAFFIILFAIGRIKGIKSAMALICSIFIIMCFMIPKIYQGSDPVLISVITALLCSIFSVIILYGFTKMSMVNLISIPLGFIFGAAVFYLMSMTLHITGFQMEDAESLMLIMQESGLKIHGLLFASVAISSLGAAMDVTVSISSSLAEIAKLDDEATSRTLFDSGMNIGKDILGTMVNTLIFAFLGGSLTTILVLISYGVQFHQLISSDFLGIEIIRGFIGTCVVILMVPISSFFSANIYKDKLPIINKLIRN